MHPKRRSSHGARRRAPEQRRDPPTTDNVFGVWIYAKTVVEMVRWTVVSPIHQGSNPDARIIIGFIS